MAVCSDGEGFGTTFGRRFGVISKGVAEVANFERSVGQRASSFGSGRKAWVAVSTFENESEGNGVFDRIAQRDFGNLSGETSTRMLHVFGGHGGFE